MDTKDIETSLIIANHKIESLQQELQKLKKDHKKQYVHFSQSSILLPVLGVSLQPYEQVIYLPKFVHPSKDLEGKGTNPFYIAYHDNGLVGSILLEGTYYSVVMLLTHIRSRIPVKSKKGALGILYGQGVAHPFIKIDKGVFCINDPIETSGYDGIFPSGIRIGYVFKIKENKAFIKPYVNFETITDVHIIEGLSF